MSPRCEGGIPVGSMHKGGMFCDMFLGLRG